MKKLLVLVDFSPCATQAAHYAMRLAEWTQSSLHLLHIASTPLNELVLEGRQAELSLPTHSLSSDYLRQEASHTMEALVHELDARTPYHRVPISYNILVGNARSEIDNFSHAFNPDLIIMGVKSSSRLERFIMGSLAKDLLQRVSFPILAIPEYACFQAIHNVLYASAYAEADNNSIASFRKLFKAFRSHVHCVHILEDDNKVLPEAEMAEKNAALKAHVEQGQYLRNLSFAHLQGKDLTNAIESYVDKHHINLMVFSTEKRNGLNRWFSPSVTQAVMFKSNIPLLAIGI